MIQYDKDIQSEYKTLFLNARMILLSYPAIIETKKERITTYSTKKGGICHLRTMDHGVDFGFLKGTALKDPSKLLHGKGKTLRVLSLKRIDEQIIRDFIQQALEINANK